VTKKTGVLSRKRINPWDPVEMNFWKGALLCAKPASDYYAATTCRAGYIQCSPGWCYNSTYGCPITNITVFRGLYPTDANTSVVSLNNMDYLYFRKDFGLSPIISIDVGVGGVPCTDKNNAPYTEFNYPLLSDLNDGCKRFGSYPQSFVIDYQLQYDLMTSNLFTMIAMNFLPNYTNITMVNTAYLTGQPRFVFQNNTSACLNLISAKPSFDVSDLEFFDYYTYVVSIVYACFHIVACTFGTPCYFFSLVNVVTRRERNEVALFSSLLSFFTQTIPDIVIFALLMIYYDNAQPFIRLITNLAAQNCFVENMLNDVITDIVKYCDNLMVVYGLIIGCFTVGMFQLGITILQPLVLWCSGP